MSRIFLVEDDEYITRVYERAFRLGGHDITTMSDGVEAEKALATIDPVPDAVVLDIMLPGMHGDTLLQNMKKNPKLASIPVAILTNSFHEDEMKHAMEIGANLFMVKIEYQPREIVAKIEELIRDRATK